MTDNFDQMALTIGQRLRKKAWMLTTAESCTGGMLAEVMTRMPGSSRWFERGFVTYSNQSKHDLLAVSMALLVTQGTVSQTVAIAMAEGAIKHSLAQVSISITGIAGPEGGRTEKPVGTVHFAIKTPDTLEHFKQVFSGTRQQIRLQATQFALVQLMRITK